MNIRHCPGMGIISLCTLLAPLAAAQESAEARETYSMSASSIGLQGFSSRLRGRSDYSNAGRELVADLERAGIVNRSQRGPYRVALPLMSFGSGSPTLMITYARKMPGTADAKGVLLFVHIPLE
jgi:hypothetical protein